MVTEQTSNSLRTPKTLRVLKYPERLVKKRKSLKHI